MVIKYLKWIWILILIFLPVALILLGVFNFLVNFQFLDFDYYNKDDIKEIEEIIGFFSILSLLIFSVFFTVLYFKLIIGFLKLIGKSSAIVLILSLSFTIFLIPRFGTLLFFEPIEYALNQISFISSLELPKLFERASLNLTGYPMQSPIQLESNSIINYDSGYEDGFKDGMEYLSKTNSEQNIPILEYFGHNYLINNLISYVFTSTYNFIKLFINDFILIIFGFILIYGISRLLSNYVFNDIEGFKQLIQMYKVSIIYFFILLAGATLSLSSIIAYPRFLEDQSSVLVKKEEFIKKLEEIEKNRRFDFSAYIGKDTVIFADLNTDTTLENASNDQYLSFLNRYKSMLEKYPSNVENLKKDYIAKVSKAKTVLELKFELEYSISSFVDKQRGKALASFYHRFNSYLDELDWSVSRFPRYESLIRSVNSYNSLIRDINNKKPLNDYDIANLENFSIINLPDFYFYNEYNSDQRRDIFKLLSDWIVKSESQEMVLITGMLGFGLLGAGISAIYRKRKFNDENFESTNFSILLGSISSAVVIYLAVKGGISIFSKGGDIEINYYSILLLCLIGSVYSEIIWERASNYIKPSNGGKDDSKTSGEKNE